MFNNYTLFRKIFLSFILLTIFSFTFYLGLSEPGGFANRTSNQSNGCGNCHGTSSSTEVTADVTSGSGSFTVEAGSTTSFTVTVSTTNTNLVNAGVNLAVKTDETSDPGMNIGTLIPGTGLRLRGTPQEITQSSPKTLSGGSASWDFEWTAPSTPGTYFLRVLAFCGDGDGNNDPDDRWNWMNVKEITVVPKNSVTVTAPNGGEEACAGTTMPVRWTSDGVSLVRIELSDNGGITFPYLLANNIDAATGQWIWQIPDDQAENTQYRIRILDAQNYNVADTGNGNFTIYAKTGFTSHPESLSICPGNTAIFRVTATGRNLQYQWRKDEINIPGANLPSLYINNATENDEGNYRCLVTGLCDSALSDNAFLNIKDIPEVVTNPVGDTLCTGESITLRVEATGLALNYSWNKNGQHIVGSNTYELTLNNVTKADSGEYVCIVSGACQPKDTSEPAYVVVYSYPAIVQMPQSQTVVEGSDVTFAVIASGDGLHYQWKKDDSDIQDSTNNTLTIRNVTKADSGDYTCYIENRCGNITTRKAHLAVISPDKPVIELMVKNVDFGNVALGMSKDTLLANVIHNNSNVSLTINSIKIIGQDAADFNVFGIQFPITIPADEYRNMNIEFIPASKGVKTASITFNTNAENTVSMSLIGYGIEKQETLTANDWDFGDVLIGYNKTSNNYVKNIGTEAVTIQKPVVTSYDSLNFKLLDEEDYPKNINPGDSAVVNFMFIPTVAKTYEVQVLVENTTPYDLWFRLKGKGIMTDVVALDRNNTIRIYPNPTREQCVIDLHQVTNVQTVSISDILGNNIREFYQNNGKIIWDLTNATNNRCDPGVYFIKIITNNDIIINKFIIL